MAETESERSDITETRREGGSRMWLAQKADQMTYHEPVMGYGSREGGMIGGVVREIEF